MKLTPGEVGRVLAAGRSGAAGGGAEWAVFCTCTTVLGSAEAHGTVNNVFAKFQCVLDFGMLAGMVLPPPWRPEVLECRIFFEVGITSISPYRGFIGS